MIIDKIKLSRRYNQILIDHDYKQCKECGDILPCDTIQNGFYCGGYLCGCRYEYSRPIDYKALDRLAMPRCGFATGGVIEAPEGGYASRLDSWFDGGLA